MTDLTTIALANGLQVVGRPAGARTVVVVLREAALEGQFPKVVTADTGNLSSAAKRDRMATAFVSAMVAGGWLPDLPPEPTPWRQRAGIPGAEKATKASLDEVVQAEEVAKAAYDADRVLELRARRGELDSKWKRLMESAKEAESEDRKRRETALAEKQAEVERALLELGLAVDERRRVSKSDEEDRGQAQGRALRFHDPEPWGKPVNGAELLDGIVSELRKYVVMTLEAAHAVALWAVYAHAFASFDTSPILAIQSPTLGCGKTTLLRILEGMTPRPYRAVGFSEATVFRLIESWQPTLLIDEADRAKDREGLVEVINAGLERGGSVPRCVGDDNEVRAFSVWAPKVLAGIGKLSRTLQDRGLVVLLKRATKEEKASVARFRARSGRPALAQHARRAARWAADNADRLVELGQREDAPLGQELDDRASEQLWLPLISVADAAGGEWPKRARDAALVLSGGRDRDEEDLGVLLVRDLATIFRQDGRGFIPTEELLVALKELDERPWKALGRAKDGLDANRLARMLRGFKVHSRQRRVGGPNATRGYDEADLGEVFARYREGSVVTPVTREERDRGVTNSAVTTASRQPVTGGVTAQTTHGDEVWAGVTGVTPPKPGNGKKPADPSDCLLCGRDACAGDCLSSPPHEEGIDSPEAS